MSKRRRFSTVIPIICLACLLVYANTGFTASGIEVSGDVTISNAGTINFPDGSKQITAATDCTGRYELNRNTFYPAGDGTVTDCRTGLTWLKNTKCLETSGGISKAAGALSWDNANTWVAGLHDGLCGLHDGSASGDWRLPTKTEWMAMVQSAKTRGFLGPTLTNAAGTGQWNQGDIFDNVLDGLNGADFWSSTPFSTNIWEISIWDGGIEPIGKTSTLSVWPVRAGQ